MKKRIFGQLVELLILVPLFLSLTAQPAQAATYTVTNTNDSGPGSLRQAIIDANANPGLDTITFSIPSTDTRYSNWTGPSDYWWKITVTSSLPTINDAVTIDGTTQTTNQGNTNPGQVGTGGTVGVDAISLPRYDKPEIEIDGSRNGGSGFTMFPVDGNASNITLKGMALFNGRRGIQSTGGTGTNRVVTDMLIGTRADGSDPGAAARIINFGVDVQPPAQLTVTRSYVGYCGQSGIVGVLSDSVLYVTYNEVFTNGWNSDAHDGIDVDGINGEVRYNLSHDNTCTTTNHGCGNGIELGSQDAGTGGKVVENNTSRNNKQGITIRKGASNNTLRKNIVTANLGPGILIADEGRNPTSGNRISQNSVYDNAGLGIDLSYGTTLTPDGVTLNNGTKNSTYPNNDMDFPVITLATLNKYTNILHVEGYVGSASGQTTFANSTLEFFIAAADPSGYGEGKTFLGTCNTSSTDGNFSCDIDVTGKGMTTDDYLTGTATDPNNNTSEFSRNYRATPTAVTLSSFTARGSASEIPFVIPMLALASTGVIVAAVLKRRRDL
ncbi:MAG: right-handed parallel beta-helix repeat-containing protein [Anaerolineae bacterium]